MVPEDITDDEKEKLLALLELYIDVIGNDNNLGCTKVRTVLRMVRVSTRLTLATINWWLNVRLSTVTFTVAAPQALIGIPSTPTNQQAP